MSRNIKTTIARPELDNTLDIDGLIERVGNRLKEDMTFGRPMNEITHGQSMYVLGVHKMSLAIKEALDNEFVRGD
tara:strand:- start:190 stop:414 length:225 start_codon:yes stop_codon:yes gene_type:complete